MGTLSLATHTEQTSMTPPEGVQALYEQHSETVYRTALRVTGNPADAEDVLQTVFMRVLHQEHPLDPEATPASYFRRAATNASLDILRRRTSRNEAPVDEGLSRASPESPPILKEQLRRALGQLDPQDAELFVLRFVEGMSNGELAELRGVEKAQIAMRIYRIRQQLQQLLDQ
jgi:RNA polymerase sigma-70 factor (ECF subfamily)